MSPRVTTEAPAPTSTASASMVRLAAPRSMSPLTVTESTPSPPAMVRLTAGMAKLNGSKDPVVLVRHSPPSHASRTASSASGVRVTTTLPAPSSTGVRVTASSSASGSSRPVAVTSPLSGSAAGSATVPVRDRTGPPSPKVMVAAWLPFTCGSSALMRRVAVSPSRRGIRTSIRMTSGTSVRAAATASTPSRAAPTTSMPWASRMLRSPSTTNWWSSASRTLMSLPPVVSPAPQPSPGCHAPGSTPLSGSHRRRPSAPA